MQLRTPQTDPRNVATDIPIMSFEAFQDTRERVADLGKHFNDSQFEPNTRGWVYLDGTLWIQDNVGQPYWLLIERSEYTSTNLDEIERALYNYAVNDGRIVEDGSPAELIAGDGQYAALHRAWVESLV